MTNGLLRSMALKFLLATASCLGSSVALAQGVAYPDRAVRVVVPAVAGSLADILARMLGEALTQAHRQTWIVDNRPGAGGVIGAEAIAKAPADGYALLFAANNIIIAPSLYPRVPYDIFRDFAPVGMVASSPNLIAVHPSLGTRSIAELVALTKSRPGGVDYGSPFPGTSAHLMMELVKRKLGMSLNHVPFKGQPQAVNETLAGRVPVVVTGMSSANLVKEGKLLGLAVTGARRSPLLPEVPTLAEVGVPDADLPLWFALFAPAGTPAPLVEWLNREASRMVVQPEFVKRLAAMGFEPRTGTSKELTDVMRREYPIFAQVIAEAGIKIE